MLLGQSNYLELVTEKRKSGNRIVGKWNLHCETCQEVSIFKPQGNQLFYNGNEVTDECLNV